MALFDFSQFTGDIGSGYGGSQKIIQPAQAGQGSSLSSFLSSIFAVKTPTQNPIQNGFGSQLSQIGTNTTGSLFKDIANIGAQAVGNVPPFTYPTQTQPSAQQTQTATQVATQPVSQGIQQSGTQAPTDVVKQVQDAMLAVQALGQQIASMQQTPNVPTEDIDITNEISPTMPSTVFSQTPKTNGDLERLIEENAKYRSAYIESLQPTEQEIAIQNELASLRAGTQQRLAELGVQPILTEVSTRQQNLLREQAQAQETLLLNRLGIEQEGRKATTEGLDAVMGFIGDDINLQLRVEDNLFNQKQAYINETNTLNDNARQTLAILLDTFKGLDYNELDINSKAQIDSIASRIGLSPSIIAKGMEITKNQLLFENSLRVSSATKSQTTGGFTEKTLPPEVRQDIIDTFSAANEQSVDITMEDMIRMFPEVATETLQDYMDNFYTPSSKSDKKWWQFWK